MSLRPQARNPCLRSYSLYALHFPVLWLVFAGLGGLQGTAALGIAMFALGLPLCASAGLNGAEPWLRCPHVLRRGARGPSHAHRGSP